MEKIKVNMSPNPLDVQTIHASQNDGEARQWEFELHNNGELIDTSNVTEQLFFKAYKGGTEQILPENTSTPTTSPFKGDIRYPQGLLTDQEFTYRQSPTEEDGLAKIKSIKGNTLVWNQLVPSLSTMSAQNGTLSVADNVATITSSSSASYLGIATSESSIVLPKGGHKYLLTAEVNSSKAMTSCSLVYGNSIFVLKYNVSANTWTKLSDIVSHSSPTGQYVQCRVFGSFEQGDTLQVRNWNYFDLTAMGLDFLTEDEFTSLFPLSYYAYNQGSLLSFNGNGIKTANEDESEEHNTTLPISTYFPTGMKSAGSVYDELTESKAITRVGSRAYQSGDESDTSVITDGTTTYYALVTPTETSFTTASLVTENAEIPLSNNDGTLIGKCTEELSAEPGFHDAKIKLSDSDGECYSNKIQLHVERSPQ